MKNKKVKYREGDLFVIELPNQVKILGLIARRMGKLLMGYFWKYDFDFNSDTILLKNNVVLITRFSGLGFEIGDWEIIKKYSHWSFDDWSFPEFKNTGVANYYSVSAYDDKFNFISDRRITFEELDNYYSDSTHGYVSLENYLLKITS